MRSDWSGIYGSPLGRDTYLQYKICKFNNAYDAWLNLHKKTTYIESSPYPNMILNPVWSTWVEFKKQVNQSSVLEYAHKIIKYNYNYSTLEIDDMWSESYGDFIFDPVKFPDPKG